MGNNLRDVVIRFKITNEKLEPLKKLHTFKI